MIRRLSGVGRGTIRRLAGPRLGWGALAVLLLGMGCGDSTAPPEPVATVTLSPSPVLVLVPGGTEMLTPLPKGASGKTLTDRAAEWSSSDEAIARVAAGLVTGVAKGTARITVSVEGKVASVEVDVRDGGVVAADGGSVTVPSGAVSVVVPAGAVAAPRGISIQPATNYPPARRFVAGTAYEFGPAGATFQQPVTIRIKYDPANVTAGSPESGLQLYEAVQGAWRRVEGSTVDTDAKIVSGQVTHFSIYGVLMQPIVDTVRVVPPSAPIAVKTSFQFTAVVKDSAGETLTRPLAWTSSDPAVLTIDPVTGAANADIPGTATITAVSQGKSGTAVVTVVPGPPAHLLRVTPETVDGAAGVALVTPPAVRVTDAYGNGIAGFAVTFAVATGGGSVAGGVTATSVNGYASPSSWTLGTAAGQNTLTATASGLPESPMTFIAIGNPGGAAAIVAASATTQSGTAGGLAATLPSVKVSDSFGNAVPGVTVTFTPGSGSGSVTGGSVVTNSSGVATVGSWRFGVTPGPQTVEAAVPGAAGSPVVFSATAAAPIPSNIAIVAGNNQTAVTLSAVAVAPAVRVTDPAGIPVPGLQVSFAVTGGGGTLTAATPVTGADGIATVGSWTMGPNPGANTITASAGALTVTFSAAAVHPTPVAIAIVEGQNQTASAGVPLPIAPAVKVTDSQGRGVPAVTVTFAVVSGGGSVAGGTAVTDATGVARVGGWIVGPGPNTMTATAPGLTGSPLTFSATGVAHVQLVTFGDSNTDFGYEGSNPSIRATSYVSNTPPRLSATAPNSPFQLAGKIEAKWKARRPETIRVVNHAIASTRTGTGRTGLGSPHALQVVNGFTRFEGEVLGRGYPWNGGEPTNSVFPTGGVRRVNSFTPRQSDYVYVSIATNDLLERVNTDSIALNIGKLVDMWVGAGLPASHFIITTLPPRDPQTSLYVPGMNAAIRRLAGERGLRLIDLAKFTSHPVEEGLWLSPDMHIDNDPVHYSEKVRDWLAERVFEILNGQ